MRRALPAAALVIALLTSAATAQARIVVGLSIAGVRLGDSAAAVKRKLGAPQTIMRSRDGKSSIYNYTSRKIVLTVRAGRGVVELNSFSPREKTAAGIGVGSTLGSVEKAYPDACPDLPAIPHCAIAKTVDGRKTSTQFDAGASRDGKHVGAVKIQWLLPIP